MSKDQILGIVIVIGALAVLGAYFYLIYTNSWLAFFIVASVAVVGVMGIVAWIGWTMATTPAPTPIEPFEEPAKSTTTSETVTEQKKE